jgi:chemotaxis protein methyltransferase CheR
MITDEEFKLFRSLIYQESGIYLKESRKDFLENRLMKRMVATGASSPYWYYKLIAETKKAELLVLLDLLTVNETSFFRNRPQIDLFQNLILPEIMKQKLKDNQKHLRIWSAGCSTGEEPYTLAMIAYEVFNNYNVFISHGSWDIKIYASDLSLTVLETANKGEYAADKMLATVDSYYLNKYFSRNSHTYKIKDELKKMVIFDFHNLKHDNGLSYLDVIFCRNVMIYFDMEEQKRLVNKFYHSLNPGGYLLLGHAETLQGVNADFQFVYDNKGTAYKKLFAPGS